MDRNTIIQSVIGLITLAMGSAVGFLFTSIGELKHGQDTMQKDVDFHTSQLADIWGKYNTEQEQKVIFLENYYKDKLAQAQENRALREQQLNFIVDYWKQKADEKR